MAMRRVSLCRRSFDIPLTILVLGATTLTLAVLASITYRVGAGIDTEERFFLTLIRPTVDGASAACAVEYGLRSAEKNDVVFVGDSTCRFGLDPARFERLTRLVAYNLGSLRGIGPSGFVITAKAYLLHHPKPRVVVLCVTPTCFEVESRNIGGHLAKDFADNYGPEVAEAVPFVGRVTYFCKRGAQAEWGPVQWLPPDIRGRDFRDVPLYGLETETYRTLRQKTGESRGFFKLAGEHGPPRGIGNPEPALIHAEWNSGVRRLAQICEEADVRLVIQFAPVSATIAQARDFAPLEAWSRDLETSYRHTSVARPIVSVYDSPLMWDGLHLNSAGVDKFVAGVARNVQAALER
jgi:hypothetical protein